MSIAQNLSAQAKLRLETARARYGWVDVALATAKRFSDQDGAFYAAGLTYFVFFSIFPLVLFGVSALGFIVFLSDELKVDIVNASTEAFPLMTQVLQEETLDNVANARFSLAAVGLALVLYTGTGGIVALEHALNRIGGLTDEGTFLQKRMRALRFLATVGIIPVISVALGAAARFLPTVLGFIAYLGGALMSVLLFAAAFKFLPAVRPSWREVLPGAAIAGAIFEVLKVVGPLYLDWGGKRRDATFGAFAATAGLLISAYLLSQVTLLAAQLNAVLAERRQSREFSLADKDKEAP